MMMRAPILMTCQSPLLTTPDTLAPTVPQLERLDRVRYLARSQVGSGIPAATDQGDRAYDDRKLAEGKTRQRAPDLG